MADCGIVVTEIVTLVLNTPPDSIKFTGIIPDTSVAVKLSCVKFTETSTRRIYSIINDSYYIAI